jgi:hypothetical protein
MIGFIDTFFLDCRGLAPFSFASCDSPLVYDWSTYIVSRQTHSAENTSIVVEKCLVPAA